MKFAVKLKELQSIKLNEISQAQMDKHHMLSLIWRSLLRLFRFLCLIWSTCRGQEVRMGPWEGEGIAEHM